MLFKGCECINQCSYNGFQAISWCYVSESCPTKFLPNNLFAPITYWTRCVVHGEQTVGINIRKFSHFSRKVKESQTISFDSRFATNA